ncbi:MAG: hypothetical protein QOH99_47, partial [Frankiaceae bacterium]|nr:hypothetical protein [Frankiaceae bacterium]
MTLSWRSHLPAPLRWLHENAQRVAVRILAVVALFAVASGVIGVTAIGALGQLRANVQRLA